MYLDHFKPIYLIFDQFEELFIFGGKAEREEFIQSVKEISESDLQCRFIFVIREEYLAGVTEFEAQIPSFLLNRVRIEKMSRANAMQAIEGPCKVNNIEFEQGFADALLEKLIPEGGEVELTYLQVYLDKIFRTINSAGIASEAQSPASLRGGTTKQSRWNIAILEELGDVKDLLGSFLDEQIRALDDPDSGLTLLKSFVSTRGTKRQVTLEEVNDFARTLGKDLPEETLQNLLQKFVALRILRDKDESNRYELRHDALAAKIYEKITLVEKELLEVRQFLDQALGNFQKRRVLLSKQDLDYIAPYEEKLYVSTETRELITTSRRHLTKARRRRRTTAMAAMIALLVIFAGFTWWAMRERAKAELKERQARALYFNSLATQFSNENPEKAIGLADYAYSLDPGNPTIYDNLLRIYGLKPHCRSELRMGGGAIISVCFSPDGKKIITSTIKGLIRLWDERGQLIRSFSTSGGLMEVQFSPDAKKVITSSWRQIQIWDTEGNLLHELEKASGQPNAVCVSMDGKIIDAGSIIKIWSLDGELLQEIRTGIVSVQVETSPDGYILTSSWDHIVQLWDSSGKECLRLNGDRAFFSPDGKYFLTSCSSRRARLWDIKGNLVSAINHKPGLQLGGFFSKGSRFFFYSKSEVQIFDIHGKQLQVYSGFSPSVNIEKIVFSPDGQDMITFSWNDSVARIWAAKEDFIEFRQSGNFPDLSLADKFQYGLVSFDEVLLCDQSDFLFEVGMVLFDNFLNEPEGKVKKKFGVEVIALFDKLTTKSKNIEHLIAYQSILPSLYVELKDKMLIQKFDSNQKLLLHNISPDYYFLSVNCYESIIIDPESDFLIDTLGVQSKLMEVCELILKDIKSVNNHYRKKIVRSIMTASKYLLEKGKQSSAVDLLKKAIGFEQCQKEVYSILPMAELLGGNWPHAKEIYATWKDSVVEVEFRGPMPMRDVFLKDLNDLESRGITHPDFAKAKALLKE
ncbi:MAG: hypothetical protein KKD31_02250 [Bacteroidetes bacterium]|nr:hypothetical protein [Bacteroidota bacterium]